MTPPKAASPAGRFSDSIALGDYVESPSGMATTNSSADGRLGRSPKLRTQSANKAPTRHPCWSWCLGTWVLLGAFSVELGTPPAAAAEDRILGKLENVRAEEGHFSVFFSLFTLLSINAITIFDGPP